MQSSKNSLSILVSPGFLVGLGLLLLNDFLLKPAFHNWFTGKLSDFAGLFIFPLFFTAFSPPRKKLIYVITAIGFVFWKSEFSQSLIELWNAQPYYQIDRVVDHTDLMALLILPLSFLSGRQSRQRQAKPLLIYVSCVVAVFAFTATSIARQQIYYTKDYKFDLTQAQLISRMEKLSAIQFPGQASSNSAKNEFLFQSKSSLPITFEVSDKNRPLEYARILVIAGVNESKISLLSIEMRNPGEPSNELKEELLRSFEKKFIEKLREEPIPQSSQVIEIWFLN